MLVYFVVFCVVGFIVGVVFKDLKLALAAMVVISVCWAFVYGPWALATFIELVLGYAVAKVITREISK